MESQNRINRDESANAERAPQNRTGVRRRERRGNMILNWLRTSASEEGIRFIE
jgi:hypothetical protein